jgi:hypothetical protein
MALPPLPPSSSLPLSHALTRPLEEMREEDGKMIDREEVKHKSYIYILCLWYKEPTVTQLTRAHRMITKTKTEPMFSHCCVFYILVVRG